MNKRNLAVAVLTDDKIGKPITKRYLPKVCHKIDNDITMIEKVLETISRLEPKVIIIIANKNNITYINKILKDSKFASKISLHIDNENKGIIVSKRCYSKCDLLVVPGNAPLLTTKTLLRLINSADPYTKISDHIYFLKKEYLDYLEDLEDKTPHIIEVADNEIIEVNNHGDLLKVQKIIEKKFQSIRRKSSLTKLFKKKD